MAKEKIIVKLNDINEIPNYKNFEAERQQNELERIANENARKQYMIDLENDVESGRFKGDRGDRGIPGEKGDPGEKGESGVWVGTSEPTDDSNVWVDLNDDSNEIPTKLSQLENDSNYVQDANYNHTDNNFTVEEKSKLANALTNPSNYYTKGEVNNLIGDLSTASYLVVQELPEIGVGNIIYLVPNDSQVEHNIHDEYMYVNNNWELIGSTQIDLTGYATENYVNNHTHTHSNKSVLDGITANDITNWNNKGTYTKPNTGIPKTDLSDVVQSSLSKADSALQEHQTLKTINNQSIVGEGNITIEGGEGGEIPTLIGTEENPINLNTIESGMYFISGYVRYGTSKELRGVTGDSVAHFVTPYYKLSNSADYSYRYVYDFNVGFKYPLLVKVIKREETSSGIFTYSSTSKTLAINDDVGFLNDLTTTAKSNLVAAINEIKAELDNLVNGDEVSY